MIVTAIKTPVVEASVCTLRQLVDEALSKDVGLKEASVLVVTSKVVSLCENRVVPIGDIAKDKLIEDESDYYLPAASSKYGIRFTLTDGNLIPTAGIDESNGAGRYVVWPRNPQRSANELRHYLRQQYGLERVAVVITDSTSRPLRRGTAGIAIAYSGLRPLNDYVGKADLFGKKITASQSDIVSGLAAAAVVTMGEGAEQTPLCVISDVPFVQFCDNNPSDEELAQYKIPRDQDIFAPFLGTVAWQRGRRNGTA